MKILLTTTLITLVLCVNGQHVPYGLRETKVQKELATRTSEFDSLVLLDKASYWDEDMKISGLAFKQNQIYKLTVMFKSGESSFYDMTIKDFRKTKISDESAIESIQKMKLFSAITLNSDSLNHKPVWDISDQNEWTMLFLKNKKITIKQSYAPEVYQPILPTDDRKLFMDLFDQISAVNN
jgi:hypothetical protein